jgi:hypothetical protein
MRGLTGDESEHRHNDLMLDLDRLVDGELSGDQRRSLLTSLDDIPNGWRRCALAFLEAQTWREAAADSFSPPATSLARPVTSTRPTWHRSLLTWLAMAASFLLAFALGLALREWPARFFLPAGSNNQIASQGNASRLPNEASPAPTTLEGESNERVETVWLPLAEEEDFSDNSPTQLARKLEALGHQVQRRQELWPIELGQGQRWVLPIDRLDVRYVGDEYQ